MLLNSALSRISPSPLLPYHTTKTHPKFVTGNTRASRRRWLPQTVTWVSSSDDPTVAVASSPPPPPPPTTTVGDDEDLVESAADVVRNFYAGINGRDLASVEDLIADNCVYEDLVFPRPFVGRKVRLPYSANIRCGRNPFFLVGRQKTLLLPTFSNTRCAPIEKIVILKMYKIMVFDNIFIGRPKTCLKDQHLNRA